MISPPPNSSQRVRAGLWKVCKRCWSIDPQKRPTAEKLIGYLEIEFGDFQDGDFHEAEDARTPQPVLITSLPRKEWVGTSR